MLGKNIQPRDKAEIPTEKKVFALIAQLWVTSTFESEKRIENVNHTDHQFTSSKSIAIYKLING